MKILCKSEYKATPYIFNKKIIKEVLLTKLGMSLSSEVTPHNHLLHIYSKGPENKKAPVS
jgi:hypothetical protein